jgi:hypothetical protein
VQAIIDKVAVSFTSLACLYQLKLQHVPHTVLYLLLLSYIHYVLTLDHPYLVTRHGRGRDMPDQCHTYSQGLSDVHVLNTHLARVPSLVSRR